MKKSFYVKFEYRSPGLGSALNIFQKLNFYMMKKRILNNILKMKNISREYSKIINYSAQSAELDHGL
jgi:hypothetical protein